MIKYLLILVSIPAFGQFGIKYWKPVGVGNTASRPAACTANKDTYINTQTNSIDYCTATNTFTAMGGVGTVTSVATTSPITGGTITGSGTIACATCVTAAAALTANLPVIGSGSQATAVGTRSGNTTQYVTSTGTQTSGDCVKIDASGNHIANGSACGAGGVITYSAPGLTLTAGTRYAPPGGGGIPSSTEADSQVKAPNATTISNFQVTVSVAPGAGNSYAFTWRKAGADQTTTCTIADTATTCTDTSNTFTAAQGDLLDVKIVSAGTIVTTPMLSWMAQVGVATVPALGDPGSNSIPYRNGAGTSVPASATEISAPLYCADAGSTDTYACTLSPAPAAYATGAVYQFKANTLNTGAATINFNSLGAKTIKKAAGGITTDLATNDILAGQVVTLTYDGTNMQMQSTLGNAGGGGGNTTATGAYASASAATAGNVYFPNNGVTLMRDTGAAFAEWAPLYPITIPVFGSFTSYNSPSVANGTGGGMYLSSTSTGSDNLRGLYITIPSAPFTIEVGFTLIMTDANYQMAGVFLNDGTKSKVWGQYYVTSANIGGYEFSNNTTTGSNYGAANGHLPTTAFIRFEDDNTNWKYSVSPDGQNWTQLYSETRNTYLTATRIGVAVNHNVASGGTAMRVFHWKQY